MNSTRRKTFTRWLELKGRSHLPYHAKVAIDDRLKDKDVRLAEIIKYPEDPDVYVEFYGLNDNGTRFIIDIIAFKMDDAALDRLFKVS